MIEIDFFDDIAELQAIDGTWSGIFVGPEPKRPDTGTLWMSTEPRIVYMFNGTAWVEAKISKN